MYILRHVCNADRKFHSCWSAGWRAAIIFVQPPGTSTLLFQMQANGLLSVIDLADSDTTAMNGTAVGGSSAMQDTAGTPPEVVPTASPEVVLTALVNAGHGGSGVNDGNIAGRDESDADARPSCYSSQQTPGG